MPFQAATYRDVKNPGQYAMPCSAKSANTTTTTGNKSNVEKLKLQVTNIKELP